MSFTLDDAVESLKENFPASVGDIVVFLGDTTVYIDKNSVFDTASHLKNALDFKFIQDITAIDYLGIRSPRYEVVYTVHRFGPDCEENVRLRLKALLPEDDMKIASVTGVWEGANWLEREVYDMFGIVFEGHPDLRRILMPEDYEAFPLRKDFDVRNREPSKRSFERELEIAEMEIKKEFEKP